MIITIANLTHVVFVMSGGSLALFLIALLFKNTVYTQSELKQIINKKG